jgi:hypothetical protein
MTRKLVEKGIVPPTIRALLNKVRKMVDSPVPEHEEMPLWEVPPAPLSIYRPFEL